MINYRVENGEIKEMKIEGDILEMVADVSTLYYAIGHGLMKDGLSYYAAFKGALMESFDKADDLIMAEARDVALGKKGGSQPLIQALVEALFGGDMEKFKKASEEAKAKAYADAEGFNDEPKKGDKK